MTFDVTLGLLGAFVLLVGFFSEWLEDKSIPPTLLALLAGILFGPHALGLLDLGATGSAERVLEVVARVTLGVGIISLTLFTPKEFPSRHWHRLLVLVVGSMILMWTISTVLTYLVLGVPLYIAAVVGAALAPTDPVAARPIIEGTPAARNLPERLRHTLSYESASNDGVAYLLVFLPFLLLTLPPKDVAPYYLVHTVLYEVMAALLLGGCLGYACGRLLNACEERNLIKEEWRLVTTAAMAFFGIGLGHYLKMCEFMLVFGAGVAFTRVVRADDRKHEEHGHEAANRFLSVPIFGLLGAAIPWEGWRLLGWKGVFLAVVVLVLRRPPAFLLLMPALGQLIRRPADALYVGWFGPIGIATVYYGTHISQRLQNPEIWNILSLVVCVSVIVHGITATPLTKLYGRVTGQREVNQRKEAKDRRRAERDNQRWCAEQQEKWRHQPGHSPALAEGRHWQPAVRGEPVPSVSRHATDPPPGRPPR